MYQLHTQERVSIICELYLAALALMVPDDQRYAANMDGWLLTERLRILPYGQATSEMDRLAIARLYDRWLPELAKVVDSARTLGIAPDSWQAVYAIMAYNRAVVLDDREASEYLWEEILASADMLVHDESSILN